MPELSERVILERLARGELSTDEADELLEDLAPPVRSVSIQLSGGGLMRVVGNDDDETLVNQDPAGDGHATVPASCDLTCLLNGAAAEISGLTGTLDATINAGPVTIDGRFSRGASRARVNCGMLTIRLDSASSVRVAVPAAGTCDVADELRETGPREWTLGDGAATLEVTGNFGLVELMVH